MNRGYVARKYVVIRENINNHGYDLHLGEYEEKPDHWYNLSNIVKIKDYSDGLDVEVYFEGTEDRPAEVTTFFYELKSETGRWLEAISKKQTSPETPSQQGQTTVIREREVIREIVKIPCRHCGELFEQTLNRCPYCNGPHT
jgi:hypothetical protein